MSTIAIAVLLFACVAVSLLAGALAAAYEWRRYYEPRLRQREDEIFSLAMKTAKLHDAITQEVK